MQRPVIFPFTIRFSLSLISIVLIIVILFQAQHILVPMIFAALFAMLLVAPCNFLERHKIPRGLAALLSFILFILIGFLVFYLVFSQIYRFKNELPGFIDQLSTGLKNLAGNLQEHFHISDENTNQLLDAVSFKNLYNTTTFLGNTFNTVSNTVVYMILIPVYTFLLLFYRGLIVVFLVRSFPEKDNAIVREVLNKCRTVIKGYVVGIFTEMIIVAVLNCTGFFILGVKYALLLGVIAAVLNIIPYLGIFTACILSMIVTYTTNSAGTVLGVAIVLVCVHLIDANFILLRVVGSKLKMNALATLCGVISGGALWGVTGMFLAIPLLSILKLIFDAAQTQPPWGLLIGEDISLPKRREQRKSAKEQKLLAKKDPD
jgi:predicted PurR-regulated permease PerM